MRNKRIAVPGMAVLCLCAAANAAHAANTYYIDQCMNYQTGGCWGWISTPEETASLQATLQLWGWTGSRYPDASAWAQDFVEQCSSTYGSGGLDGAYADSKGLVVFSGHGSQGELYFAYPHSGDCQFGFDANGRLGSMSGAQAAIGMWLTCRAHENFAGFQNQWLRQSLAFMGDIWLGANDAMNAVVDTKTVGSSPGLPTAIAWLQVMDSGTRHPIAVTMSNSSMADCWIVAGSAKMGDNVLNTPRGGGPSCNQGQPIYYWCAEYY